MSFKGSKNVIINGLMLLVAFMFLKPHITRFYNKVTGVPADNSNSDSRSYSGPKRLAFTSDSGNSPDAVVRRSASLYAYTN